MAFVGSKLYVPVPDNVNGIQTLGSLDIHAGKTQALRVMVPERANAQRVLSTDRRALLFVAWLGYRPDHRRHAANRLLSARGGAVVVLDTRDTAGPEALQTIVTGTALRKLRVDEPGERIYGVGQGAFASRQPIFDLRGAPVQVSGQHDVEDWVQRRDKGELSVRLQPGGRVDVARVIR